MIYECDDCEDTGTCYDCGGFGCRECDFTGDCPWCSIVIFVYGGAN